MNTSLLQLLADGKFHSGDELGQALGVSRAAIWKSCKKIADQGLDLHSVRGKGYRLSQALELLDRDVLLSGIESGHGEKIIELELLSTIDSTNSHAMRQIRDANLDLSGGKVAVCLAEQQTAGRGRRGREWASPFGHNMYLSLVREFESGAVGLEGLSLVVGLALVRALTQCGIEGLGVKWPNDVLWNNKKVAGILLEMSGDVTGSCQVVIGLGLNIRMQEDSMRKVDQPWIDLCNITSTLPGRNLLIAQVINALMGALDEFELRGFQGFMQEWSEYDVLSGHQVELKRSLAENSGDGVTGLASGVNEKGAFLIDTEDGLQSFHGGEVSVRKRGETE